MTAPPLLLVSGATKDVGRFDVGTLVVPSARNLPGSLDLRPGRWAMDNGAFSEFDEPAYLRMLAAHAGIPGCLFATAPDVVGDAWATMRLWHAWHGRIRAAGFPPALVAQDGLSVWETPWDDVGALFIGGTTAFKLGPVARALAAAAIRRGKWVHMGRVNTRRRLHYAAAIGCGSVDGSGFSKWPATNLPLAARWTAAWRRQPGLFV